ncbi:hypothetical protein PR202_gb15674 [Eleusine coracana subsp. coracana]|uniref:Reverse transcriptase zinc-binding domain-containing protein n=1 Tax=Eleusine coracana subsp. coracana TaxID=191504 RepID=A0AAV5EYH6_ELECO|nr:hypothetical protein PR202_gb15674 [Eleusine coracana subsp. coracana]
MQIDQAENRVEGSSANPDGSRMLFKKIWSAAVPQKVRVFAWRLAKEGLATQVNRQHRRLIRFGTCEICGMEDESGFYVVVRCTKAYALRQELRKEWILPEEEQFRDGGKDWLLILLDLVGENTGARILLMFWRAWHLQNDIIHGKGTSTVIGSARFLYSYGESLHIAMKNPQTNNDAKEKVKIYKEEMVDRRNKEGSGRKVTQVQESLCVMKRDRSYLPPGDCYENAARWRRQKQKHV